MVSRDVVFIMTLFSDNTFTCGPEGLDMSWHEVADILDMMAADLRLGRVSLVGKLNE